MTSNTSYGFLDSAEAALQYVMYRRTLDISPEERQTIREQVWVLNDIIKQVATNITQEDVKALLEKLPFSERGRAEMMWRMNYLQPAPPSRQQRMRGAQPHSRPTPHVPLPRAVASHVCPPRAVASHVRPPRAVAPVVRPPMAETSSVRQSRPSAPAVPDMPLFGRGRGMMSNPPSRTRSPLRLGRGMALLVWLQQAACITCTWSTAFAETYSPCTWTYY